MTTVTDIKEFHKMLIKKIQLVELVSLKFYENLASLNEEELKKHFEEFSNFYSASIIYHFKIEESALLPILKRKGIEKEVDEIIQEHKLMNSLFESFKNEKDYKKAIELLKKIIEIIRSHTKKEDELLEYVVEKLSPEDLKEIDELLNKFKYQ